MSTLPPPTPPDLPEMPEVSRRSRYRRPRRYMSWTGLILGLLAGTGLGIFVAWMVLPVEEVNTAPWQLRSRDKAEYVVAVVLRWSHDGDLAKAINALVDLRLGGEDPLQAVANVACELASTGYVNSSSGLRAIRSLIQFYELQGRMGCASVLLPVPSPQGAVTIVPSTATATIPPPPSKTPTPEDSLRPSPTQPVIIVPTTPPQRNFTLARVETFCDAELSGIIEVRVRDSRGQPLPGTAVRVRWDSGEDLFFTGLKPERGADYADFKMEPGKGYTVEIRGSSDPSQSLNAVPCFMDGGGEAVTSFRVVFSSR